MGILKIVKFWEDERVDVPDRNAFSTLAEAARRVIGRIVGEPRVDAADVGYAPGCVLTESSVGFAAPDVTIASGLRMLCANPSVSGDGPNGDYLELEAGVTIADACPTVDVEDVLVLARPSALTDGDSAARIFYDSTMLKKTKELSKATRQWRTPEWTSIAADDDAGIALLVADGYQHVVALEYNGGSPQVSRWYSAFPLVSNATRYPAGALRSLVQAVHALAAEIRTMKNSAPSAKWDDNLAHATNASMFQMYAAQIVLQALTGHATHGNLALDARVDELEPLLDTYPWTRYAEIVFRGGANDPVLGDIDDVEGYFGYDGITRASTGVYSLSRVLPVLPFKTMSVTPKHWVTTSTYENWRFETTNIDSSNVTISAYVCNFATDGAWELADPPNMFSIRIQEIS